ncbi:hypothetical protein PENTCL1PPCAC_30238 [Pristionchus entomophagus]|uniref:Uncharacterized protein n=1 Tax=Pristionchus entomophagus TaxID=358040 RepID=A0AAV5SAT2_9BILA|nr:hypothetical protein PENTCL1PPCAC_1892 [Pristionchus entomophagus]GMT08064.1 hypothetical protein PENTCL1PPCAC_30238 [Pristionchus entomophagus]
MEDPGFSILHGIPKEELGMDSRKRNMERRRESSRFAARDRRAKESDIYDDLKDVVPVVEEPTITHVDRIALLRVAATVCRYRKNVGNALTAAPASASLLRRSLQREIQGESPWCEESITECLDGFILIADSDGVILYVTESVSLFLGLTQTDFAGRHLKDFIAPEDYKDYLACTQQLTAEEEDLEMSRACVLRIKTVISPRGRNLNLKSAILKPVSFNIRVLVSAAGHCHLLQAMTVPAGQGTVSSSANAITKQGDSPSGTFMTRHTCDMRLSYVSEQLYGLLKSDSRSLMGASYYELVHPADAESLRASIQELLQKGHTRTPYYRLITGAGTVAWIMTEANTVTHTTRGQKGQYIIGIHHMLGQQTEDECDRGACEGVPAGLAVRIKQEPDDREYLVRQPEILDCVDFTPLMGDAGEFRPVPQAKTRRGGAFGDLSHSAPFNSENNDSAPTRKQSYDEVLQWLFRDQQERIGEEEGESREEGERWRAGGGAERGYGVQAVSTTSPCDPFSGAALRRATIGAAEGAAARGRLFVGGVIGRGGSVLQGPTVQSQQPLPSHYQRQQPVSSPQNALSSSFTRACDLSSPPHSAASGPRPNTPVAVAHLERELRSEELRGRSFEDGRIMSGVPQTNAFPLPFGAGRGDPRAFGSSEDVLASLPPPGFTAAEPLIYGVRRGQRGMKTSLVSSGYGSTANSCSPSSSSSTASSTPLIAAVPPSSSLHASRLPPSLCDPMMAPSSTTSRMYKDDSLDALGNYAPFLDPAFDIPIGAGGLPKDFFLDLPPCEADGLPNFYDPLEPDYPTKATEVPPAKRAPEYSATSQGGLFDDFPTWLEQNPSFIDGRM